MDSASKIKHPRRNASIGKTITHWRHIHRVPVVTAALAVVALSSTAPAIVIPDSHIFAVYDPTQNQLSAAIDQDPTGNITAINFDYTGTTIREALFTVDEGSDWYLANLGDNFSAPAIAANKFPVIFKIINQPPFEIVNTVSIPLGNFYVGINTGEGAINSPTFRNVFGWLELNNDGTTLTSIANAVAYAEQGIFIGTTNAVPEPATLALLSLAAFTLIRRRPLISH